jgi:hypothetical protein
MGRACDGSAQDDALKGADHSFQLAGLMQCHLRYWNGYAKVF